MTNSWLPSESACAKLRSRSSHPPGSPSCSRAAAFGDAEPFSQVRQPFLLPVDDDEQAAEVGRGERVLVAVAERPGQLERALGRRTRGRGALGQPLLPGQ